MKFRRLHPIVCQDINKTTIHDYGDITRYYFINGDMCWANEEGNLHCLTGPAKIFNKGTESQWWINGEQIECSSQEEFKRIIKIKAFL
jgi:hypothetical protein